MSKINPEPIREAIVEFFKENPDESLTFDDIVTKFGNGEPKWLFNDILFELQDENILDFHLVSSVYCYVARKPRKTPKKHVARAAKKPRRKGAWYPTEAKPEVRHIAPLWMRENLMEPWQRYQAHPMIDTDKVRQFWNKALEGESCELWVNVANGEKDITHVYERMEEGWVPLMRSVRGSVFYATSAFNFAVRL